MDVQLLTDKKHMFSSYPRNYRVRGRWGGGGEKRRRKCPLLMKINFNSLRKRERGKKVGDSKMEMQNVSECIFITMISNTVLFRVAN